MVKISCLKWLKNLTKWRKKRFSGNLQRIRRKIKSIEWKNRRMKNSVVRKFYSFQGTRRHADFHSIPFSNPILIIIHSAKTISIPHVRDRVYHSDTQLTRNPVAKLSLIMSIHSQIATFSVAINKIKSFFVCCSFGFLIIVRRAALPLCLLNIYNLLLIFFAAAAVAVGWVVICSVIWFGLVWSTSTHAGIAFHKQSNDNSQLIMLSSVAILRLYWQENAVMMLRAG